MNNVIGVLLFSLAIYSSLSAQTKQIVVLGHGEVFEAANQAEFSFIIQRDGRTLKTAFVEAQQYVNRIFTELLSIGLDSSGFQQSRVRVSDKSIAWLTTDKVEAVLRTRVVLNDINQLETVLGILGKYELSYLSDVQFNLRDNTELKERAYVAALNDAKRNAAAIAQSTGLVISEIVSIEETGEVQTSGSNLAYRYERYGKMSSMATPVEITPERIIQSKQLKVCFSLK